MQEFETYGVWRKEWMNRYGHFIHYDTLVWEVMKHKLNLRNGETVKITVEKIKEI